MCPTDPGDSAYFKYKPIESRAQAEQVFTTYEACRDPSHYIGPLRTQVEGDCKAATGFISIEMLKSLEKSLPEYCFFGRFSESDWTSHRQTMLDDILKKNPAGGAHDLFNRSEPDLIKESMERMKDLGELQHFGSKSTVFQSNIAGRVSLAILIEYSKRKAQETQDQKGIYEEN